MNSKFYYKENFYNLDFCSYKSRCKKKFDLFNILYVYIISLIYLI